MYVPVLTGENMRTARNRALVAVSILCLFIVRVCFIRLWAVILKLVIGWFADYELKVVRSPLAVWVVNDLLNFVVNTGNSGNVSDCNPGVFSFYTESVAVLIGLYCQCCWSIRPAWFPKSCWYVCVQQSLSLNNRTLNSLRSEGIECDGGVVEFSYHSLRCKGKYFLNLAWMSPMGVLLTQLLALDGSEYSTVRGHIVSRVIDLP